MTAHTFTIFNCDSKNLRLSGTGAIFFFFHENKISVWNSLDDTEYDKIGKKYENFVFA